MKPQRLFILMLSMLALTANAQFDLKMRKSQKAESGSINSSLKPDKNKFSSNSFNKTGNGRMAPGTKKVIADSAYYRDFVKRNGWFEGRGKRLTLEEASHLSCYYKFSKKNSAGNWTLMQAYNAYGQLTTQHGYSAYILNQFDDKDAGANKEWKEKMQSMCQIELIGSNDGKDVVQERSLDASGNVVFTAIPTKTGKNTYLYSYIDSWGRPIYVRTDSLGNDLGYANFVEVTRDQRGYEVLYKFTDRNGIPAKNVDGAYMSRREYDDRGYDYKTMSLNVLGNMMIDDFGNCGMEYTYDDNGFLIKAMSHNAEWKPESRSGSNGRSDLDDGSCGYWFKRDKYGREIERGFLDTLGHKCVNRYGAYRIEREYDDHGNQIHAVSFDEKGNKVAMDSLGTAEIVNTVDKDGNFTSTITLNAKGGYVNDADGACKYTRVLVNGAERENTQYEAIGDSLRVKFHLESDSLGNTVRYWPKDDLVRVDSVNQRGEETLLAWYDLNLKPKNWWGFHRRVSEYQYEPQKRAIIQKWFDKNGNWADEQNADGSTNGYTGKILISDSLAHTETIYRYIGDMLNKAYVLGYDEEMRVTQSQCDLTLTGEQTRVGWWDVLFYNAKVEYDYNGEIKSYFAINEFGEPSYLSSLDSDLVYHFQYKNGKVYNYFDENGNLINKDSLSVFYQKLPSVYSIEVTDTASANVIGVKNNDVILSYGDWTLPKDLMGDKNYFYLELIIKNLENKDMTILRHHPDKNSSEVIRLKLPKGSLEQFGFYPHLIYYTQREKQRLIETIAQWNFELGADYKKGTHEIILDVPKKGSVESTPMYWAYNRREPYMIVSADQQSPLLGTKDFWFADNGTHAEFSAKRMLLASVKALKHAVLTSDLSTVVEDKWDQTMGSTLKSLYLDDENYEKLLKLCAAYKQGFKADTTPYDWRKHSGKLSLRQLSDSLQTLTEGYAVKENETIVRDDWSEVLAPFSRLIVYTFDKDVNNPLNQKAVEFIGCLNKKNYTEVKSEKINSALYIAKRDPKSKDVPYFTDALCVAGQYIYVFEGYFTEEQLHRVWGN